MHTKKIEIKDMDNTLYFNVHLFDVEKGLDFVDKFAQSLQAKTFSIRPYLSDLLPLADLLDVHGNEVVKTSLQPQDCYEIFQNPLAVLELGIAILEQQKVFMENSKLFQPLMKMLENIWSIKASGLGMK